MNRRTYIRFWPVLVLLAFGAALFAASFFIGRSAREGSDPVEAAPDTGGASSTETVGAQGTPSPTPKFIEREIERLQATSDADYAKLPFSGELGNFLVVAEGGTAGDPKPVCDGKWEERANPTGELAFPAPPGAASYWSVTACPDGSLSGVGIRIETPYGNTGISRGYFLEERRPVPIRAPRARLQLRDVAGFEALVELSVIADPVFSRGHIYVIERLPSDDQPGISWTFPYYGPVEEAITFLESVMDSSRR